MILERTARFYHYSVELLLHSFPLDFLNTLSGGISITIQSSFLQVTSRPLSSPKSGPSGATGLVLALHSHARPEQLRHL